MTRHRTGRAAAAAAFLALLSFTGAGCSTLGVMIGGVTGGGMQVTPTPAGVNGGPISRVAPVPPPGAVTPRG